MKHLGPRRRLEGAMLGGWAVVIHDHDWFPNTTTQSHSHELRPAKWVGRMKFTRQCRFLDDIESVEANDCNVMCVQEHGEALRGVLAWTSKCRRGRHQELPEAIR